MRLRRLGLIGLLLLSTAACSGEGGGERTARRGAPAPVILISVDTLRSDRLPMYGYEGIETPAYDALRRDAVLVERAYAHLPLTLPSHTSMFTGRLPVEHGLRDNLGYKVDASIPTLPEILRTEGWSTGAAVSAYVLRASTGIARGFESYDDEIQAVTGIELGGLQRAGDDTLDRALSWLEQQQGTPFLFLHLYEPHSPYTPPEPFASRYEDPYDGEIAASDAILARLWERLRALELYDEALIALVSDHGEGLMDHGEMEHEVLIYRETLQVPMLFKLPGNERAGETVTAPAQIIDVLPTVLDVVGVDAPSGLQGKSVLQLTEADRERLVFSESVYPKIHFGWSDLASMIEDRYHFIDGPDPELYDLLNDPAETENIIQRERAVARRLRGAIGEIDRSLLPPSEVDPSVRASLLTLGYVGGGGSAKPTGADPKAKVHVLEELGQASRLYARNEFEEAARAYQRVLDGDPGMVYAREQLAKALRRSGRIAEAIAELRTALEDSGGAPHIALSAAELYLSQGELEEAEAHAEIAKTQNEAAWDLLTQIALRRGDLESASSLSETALSLRGTRVEPLLTLTELRVLQSRFADALQVAAEAEREFGQRPDREVLRGLYLQKGIAFANLQRNDEAEQAFLAEIELSPRELVPYSRLAVLYVVRNEPQKAVDALRRMVERNDRPAAFVEAAKTFRALGNEGAAQGLLATARQRFPGAPELR
ncbi:MAG: sulfatase-like hydrolase/transferase [Acidobacteriota bacterium]